MRESARSSLKHLESCETASLWHGYRLEFNSVELIKMRPCDFNTVGDLTGNPGWCGFDGGDAHV